ncbi:MAG TPA: prepilin-type N-terminal cleavage/methylation domain-containing protein [Pyrinomonadaceae bacterium]|jgi:prepilin-type N-terminal cleavage/methylation domain-containing protein
MNPPGKSQRGFSLIELLIVVVIIGILAAIAIPLFERAKQPANAASAINSLRIIYTSELSYKTLYAVYADLSTLSTAGYMNDSHLSVGRKSNYLFSIAVDADPSLNYGATAAPVYDPTTSRYFFVDATGVIRTEAGAAATNTSVPID